LEGASFYRVTFNRCGFALQIGEVVNISRIILSESSSKQAGQLWSTTGPGFGWKIASRVVIILVHLQSPRDATISALFSPPAEKAVDRPMY